MTTYDISRPASRGGFLSGFIAAVIAWNDARQTRNALERLSDHQLADIGLNRGDIDAVAERLAR
jgi:uncharacterized protein YjiS (DUF1127 family)